VFFIRLDVFSFFLLLLEAAEWNTCLSRARFHASPRQPRDPSRRCRQSRWRRSGSWAAGRRRWATSRHFGRRLASTSGRRTTSCRASQRRCGGGRPDPRGPGRSACRWCAGTTGCWLPAASLSTGPDGSCECPFWDFHCSYYKWNFAKLLVIGSGQKYVPELVHTSIHEQQGGVFLWQNRTWRYMSAAKTFKVVLKNQQGYIFHET